MRDPIDDFCAIDGDEEDEEDPSSNEKDEEDFAIIGSGGSTADQKFDTIVGALEDILVDAELSAMQSAFLSQHCSQFDDAEENKLIYTQVFAEYTLLVEGFLERRLIKAVPDFSMSEFLHMLKTRGEEELSADVLEVLVVLGDFAAFKELMLAHKRSLSAHAQEMTPLITRVAVPGPLPSTSASAPPTDTPADPHPTGHLVPDAGSSIQGSRFPASSIPYSAPVANKR
eukprot:EC125226.1.p1 GENE.EC125226.1~~EC125226.1.p1  ORF type:complete len:258 (+),score=48.00 EC125226.1:93-776(+)